MKSLFELTAREFTMDFIIQSLDIEKGVDNLVKIRVDKIIVFDGFLILGNDEDFYKFDVLDRTLSTLDGINLCYAIEFKEDIQEFINIDGFVASVVIEGKIYYFHNFDDDIDTLVLNGRPSFIKTHKEYFLNDFIPLLFCDIFNS